MSNDKTVNPDDAGNADVVDAANAAATEQTRTRPPGLSDLAGINITDGEESAAHVRRLRDEDSAADNVPA